MADCTSVATVGRIGLAATALKCDASQQQRRRDRGDLRDGMQRTHPQSHGGSRCCRFMCSTPDGVASESSERGQQFNMAEVMCCCFFSSFAASAALAATPMLQSLAAAAACRCFPRLSSVRPSNWRRFVYRRGPRLALPRRLHLLHLHPPPL